MRDRYGDRNWDEDRSSGWTQERGGEYDRQGFEQGRNVGPDYGSGYGEGGFYGQGRQGRGYGQGGRYGEQSFGSQSYGRGQYGEGFGSQQFGQHGQGQHGGQRQYGGQGQYGEPYGQGQFNQGQRGYPQGGWQGRQDWNQDDPWQGRYAGQGQGEFRGQAQFSQGGYEATRHGQPMGQAPGGQYGQSTGESSQWFGPGQFGQGEYGQGQWQGLGRFEQGQGRFRGAGPKGYMRSDDRIREDVNDRLEQHEELDAHEIEVKVSDAVVTLTGTIPDRWMKRMAEDLADSCQGVKDVRNELRVESHEHDQQAMSPMASQRSGSGSTSTQQTSRTQQQTPAGQSRS